MPRFPKPSEGSWTEHYPQLGTAPVSYEDSTSPEFYERERRSIFKRVWLNVGRVEQLPQVGSYFTKQLDVVNTSLLIVRGLDDRVRAFHNVCRHRGNRLVYVDDPRGETSGSCRQFACKYHGWRYALDGSLAFVQQEGEFFDLDKAAAGLVPAHCDVWAGFIFINVAPEPEQSLREFLGPMITNLEGYPFERMTSRFAYRTSIQSNWKIFMDAFQEFYHAPIVHAGQSPDAYANAAREAGFEAPHYRIEGPHRLVSTAGIRFWELPDEMLKPMEPITRGGLFGPWDPAGLGELPVGVNPAKCNPWGLDSFQLFPNFTVLIWSQGWYLTYHYWPTSHNTHVFEGNVYFMPPRSPRERIAQEMSAVTFKEFALQDANTLQATQLGIESGYVGTFHLNDQEVLCRHLHHEVAKWVEEYESTPMEVR